MATFMWMTHARERDRIAVNMDLVQIIAPRADGEPGADLIFGRAPGTVTEDDSMSVMDTVQEIMQRWTMAVVDQASFGER